jgi:hypothetical protein
MLKATPEALENATAPATAPVAPDKKAPPVAKRALSGSGTDVAKRPPGGCWAVPMPGPVISRRGEWGLFSVLATPYGPFLFSSRREAMGYGQEFMARVLERITQDVHACVRRRAGGERRRGSVGRKAVTATAVVASVPTSFPWRCSRRVTGFVAFANVYSGVAQTP